MGRAASFPSVRFDDLRASGSAFELTDCRDVFTATDAADVAEVIGAAEAAAHAGRWVAGFVCYDAAAGLGDQPPAATWPSGHPLVELPSAWFATFTERREVPAVLPPEEFEQPRWQLDRDEQWHCAAVDAVRNAIAAGDFYQLNLTARLTSAVSAIDSLYASLAHTQRGAYNALLRTGEFSIVSASPELFLDWRDGLLRTSPMKGTARRGRWPAEDAAHAQQLRRSPKERAENTMIVDLVRNDLARIAETGSVAVEALFDVERYPTLWQLTSTVAARPRAGVGLLNVFDALFPAGSVTGAPKGTAMTGIARLEGRARGVYCGAVGYLEPGRPTRARFSVAIRTVTVADTSGYGEYGSGGGITWSSEAAAEWRELLTKTSVLAPAPAPGALLETMRFEPGTGVHNRARHLHRLAASADYFGFAYDCDQIDRILDDALRAASRAVRVRLVLDAAGAVSVDIGDVPASRGPVRLAVADRTMHSSDVTLFHKGADRARYTALRGARPDADDVIIRNERGELTETTIANLALCLDGQWVTPALHCGLLPGVERARLLDDGTLTERVVTLDDLRSAEEVAVLNSLRGWRMAELVSS